MAPKIRVPLRVHLIERDPGLFEVLRTNTARYAPYAVERGAFEDLIPRFAALAKTESVFLYLDPFTVTGLPLASLDRVFAGLRAGSSVEMLLNFSGGLLTRVMCALMKLPVQPDDVGDHPLDGASNATAADLDLVLGGDWWQPIARSTCSFPEKVEEITRKYCDQLRGRFHEVCHHDIREHSSHKVPKYTLVFASRHPDALELMNDAMIKSRDQQAADEAPSEPTLFETRPVGLVPEKQLLGQHILNALGRSTVSRGALIIMVIREHFGEFRRPEIRGAIESLLRQGVLRSKTNATRINDDVELWNPNA